jgi:hypothetical protein
MIYNGLFLTPFSPTTGVLVELDKIPMDAMGPPRGGSVFSSVQSTPNPYAGNRTPGWGAQGRTPNPYATDGRTPAWNASSATPNPYAAGGGKTPAWNAASRTPNPYAQGGGQTPAWNAQARTPNPYSSGSGGTGGWGGATPKAGGGWGDNSWRGSGGSSPVWGGQAGGMVRPHLLVNYTYHFIDPFISITECAYTCCLGTYTYRGCSDTSSGTDTCCCGFLAAQLWWRVRPNARVCSDAGNIEHLRQLWERTLWCVIGFNMF